MYNTKFIEITTGLKEGDRVLLAPPFDPDEKDLGGAVLTEGEEIPAGTSNQVVRPVRGRDGKGLIPGLRPRGGAGLGPAGKGGGGGLGNGGPASDSGSERRGGSESGGNRPRRAAGGEPVVK